MTLHSNNFLDRINGYPWATLSQNINESGYLLLPNFLKKDECQNMIQLYQNHELFRKKVIMGRHGFGRGEYKYFTYPLPSIMNELRTALYPHLAKISNSWNDKLNLDYRYPTNHQDFLNQCKTAGQTKATPLMLKYEKGDYCCLHQDLYGEHVFPIQVIILLTDPEVDFEGGGLMLTEQRAQHLSKSEVIPLRQGDAVAFAVNHRPIKGQRGYIKVATRHGVGRIYEGHRITAGLIFHDAIS